MTMGAGTTGVQVGERYGRKSDVHLQIERQFMDIGI